jgi:hypothetical protein
MGPGNYHRVPMTTGLRFIRSVGHNSDTLDVEAHNILKVAVQGPD